MFSYVFMKILEGRPRSYDKAMDKASGGQVREAKKDVAAQVPEEARVLEVGCGTGELASMVLSRAATVEGFDVNGAMVEAARERILEEGLEGRFQVRQMGVDGMDGLGNAAYDAVVSTLVFSELSDDERRFALKHAHRSLKSGGLLVIADEVVPRTTGKKTVHSLVRAPAAAITYLVSKSSTRPIADLVGEMTAAGFFVEKEERSHGDAFALVVAGKKEEG